MQLIDLKKSIKEKDIPDDFLIFVCSDTDFLAKQYIEEISVVKNMTINKINSLQETVTSAISLVFNYNSYLNILTVDNFDEKFTDYDQFTNTIVLCKKVDKSIIARVDDYCVSFVLPEPWQIIDYIKVSCKGLDDEHAEALYNCCARLGTDNKLKVDLYRIENELDKIKLFDESQANSIVEGLLLATDTDLVQQVKTYDLVDAIIKKDLNFIKAAWKVRNYCDFQATYLTALLVPKFRDICLVLAPTATAEAMHMSPKQFSYLKSQYSRIPRFIERAKNILKFISDIDRRLKEGKLDLDEYQKEDYILSRILSF